jgi:hypothetical protein
MALFSALLVTCGLALFGLGTGMSVESELGAGFLSVCVGLLTLYGGYLFGRASWRTRSAVQKAQRTVSEVQAHRRKLKAGAALGLVSAASAMFVPAPGAFKVIVVVIAVLGVFVGLAAQVEPRKTRH